MRLSDEGRWLIQRIAQDLAEQGFALEASGIDHAGWWWLKAGNLQRQVNVQARTLELLRQEAAQALAQGTPAAA